MCPLPCVLPPCLRLRLCPSLRTSSTLAVVAPIFSGQAAAMESKWAESVTKQREFERLEALDNGLDPPVHLDKE